MNLLYQKAKEDLLSASNDDCLSFFVENGYCLEVAYYKLYHSEPSTARKIFLSISDVDIRAHWGAFIASICEQHITGYPTYLELRNFFEIDFNILFQYCLGNYVEEICKYADWMATINPEIYKYIGRVFIKNSYPDFGLYYLNLAKNYFYNDPELHYLFAEYYFENHDDEMALKYANNCLEVLPQYFPAHRLIKKLTSSL